MADCKPAVWSHWAQGCEGCVISCHLPRQGDHSESLDVNHTNNSTFKFGSFYNCGAILREEILSSLFYGNIFQATGCVQVIREYNWLSLKWHLNKMLKKKASVITGNKGTNLWKWVTAEMDFSLCIIEAGRPGEGRQFVGRNYVRVESCHSQQPGPLSGQHHKPEQGLSCDKLTQQRFWEENVSYLQLLRKPMLTFLKWA